MIATLRMNAGSRDGATTPGAGEVHLWRFACDAKTAREHHARLGSCVSANERQRADRFARAELREAFLLQHGVLRRLLARYAGAAPEALRFAFGPRGKPRLVDHALRFNLAHASDQALLAIAGDVELGVDLEQLRGDLDPAELGELVCAPDELAWLRSFPAAQQRRAFLRIWCRKEAALKATGVGLIDRLPSLSVLADSVAVRSLRPEMMDVSMMDMSTICLRDLELDERHAGALATSRSVAALSREELSREL